MIKIMELLTETGFSEAVVISVNQSTVCRLCIRAALSGRTVVFLPKFQIRVEALISTAHVLS